MARGAPGIAGGGGTDGRPSNNDQNSGGGGGGNGGAGGRGGYTWNTVLDRGGHGGAAFSAAAPDRLIMGGGGGAGTRNNTPSPPNDDAASSGGRGGGIVMIRAGTLTGTGSITADGGVGVVPLNDGSGGGGAGGSILLTAETWNPTSLTVSAAGGAGADNWVTQPPGTDDELTPGAANNRHGPGGGGGGGVIYLSSGINTATDVSGGPNGTTTTARSPFGALPGSAGLVRTDVGAAELTTSIAGARCLPLLTTVKATSTPVVINTPSGTSAEYTIRVSNAAGLGTALAVRISDALPAGFGYASTEAIVLDGGAARISTEDPAPGDTDPTWGVFTLPGGGSIAITFTVSIASSVPDGTYQNPAESTYSDPERVLPDGTVSAGYDPASSTGEDIRVTSQPTVIDPAVAKSGDPASASIGEIVTFTLLVTNNGNADAENVQVTDVLPTFLDVISVVVSPPGPTVDIMGSTVTIDFGTLSPDETYSVTITTLVNSLASPPGGVNVATLTTSSPDSDPANNQASAAIAIVQAGAPAAPETGFAPGQISFVLPAPAANPYRSYGTLWLEIPALEVKIPILGVPQLTTGWDVTWLWDQAGYLIGTAFPTTSGNSVLTAHVWLASGKEGPFYGLQMLRYGQPVIVHAWGLRYVYAVREVDLVAAQDPSIFRHEERPWITLVTCHDYDERLAAYRQRVAVHAVLVAIEDEQAQPSRRTAAPEGKSPADRLGLRGVQAPR